jgi:hypothetical protein
MGEKMSIFEKMGLVEKVETETEKPEEEKETNIFVAEEVERLTQLVNEMKGKNQHQDKPLEGSVNDSPFGRLMTITEIYQRYNLNMNSVSNFSKLVSNPVVSIILTV